ncbi:MAG: D-alanyl-D-alanine carboxypeptidase family protein [Candidatus Dormibacteria bacterium]
MPSHPSRSRTVAFLVAVAMVSAVAVLGARAGPSAALTARAASTQTAANLPRPAWYGMQLVRGHVQFVSAAAPAHPPVIHALGGILVDIDSNTIVWQQNAHAQLPPASTTKILTALVALQNLNLSREVTITPSDVRLAWDESRMGLLAGQTLTVSELLTGMLMVSGNDAATAIAADTVGIERFVGAMNAEVDALGLHDSHFTSTVGLQDPDQYSSAYDLAAISAAAVRHFPVFREIVAMDSADLPATAGHADLTLHSINALLDTYPAAVGIKPGWTADAGYCEVGMAVRDGHRLISVLLNAPYAFSQSRRLLDWGFVQEGLPSTLPAPSPAPSPGVTPTPHG